jgi:hypothetical protein
MTCLKVAWQVKQIASQPAMLLENSIEYEYDHLCDTPQDFRFPQQFARRTCPMAGIHTPSA